ncbi:hypothetical protein M3Y99_01947900 [Aphelenchoides fujianensis]|nr:hypothetical protein M3Y99_01947900 [Aphelenchoides fujianensis]
MNFGLFLSIPSHPWSRCPPIGVRLGRGFPALGRAISSFVPIPSPFGLPRPKTSQEIAASQIVNAAQGFVDQLRSKTNASTELIEAVKEALARFRSTLTNPAVPPAAASAGLNGELESTWKNIMDGGWLERAFAEWAFADAGRPLAADPSAPDSLAAARKVDELWREAMVASSLSTAQHSETGVTEGRSKAFRPFRAEAGRFHRVPLRDQPIGERKEASGIPINCQLLCSILKTIHGDSPNTRPN